MLTEPTATEPAVDTVPQRRYRRSFPFLAVLSGGWLGAVVLAALFADVLPLQDPSKPDYNALSFGPTWSHLLGTDVLGRDNLSRLIFGARASLVISVSSVLIGLVIGGLIGLAIGYLGGRLETFALIVTDAFLAVPGVILLLTITAIIGQGYPSLILGLSIASTLVFVRLSRANTKSFAQREFVLAARSYGARRHRLILREVMPLVAAPVAAYAFVLLGVMMVAEGSLSFLGVGVQPPTASWGVMIADAKPAMTSDPLVVLIPSAFMFVTVLAATLVGEWVAAVTSVREVQS